MPTRLVSEVIEGGTVATVLATDSIRKAARLMKENHTSAVLAVDSKHQLVGICTERDVVIGVVAAGKDPGSTTVASVMTEKPRTISPDKPFSHALHLMYEGGFRHVPVVDDRGRPLGLLSARDALKLDQLQFEHELVQREDIAAIL